jgi:hypothetical protein
MFKVDTLLAVFAFLVRQLLATADKADNDAQQIQFKIDDLSAQKRNALSEAGRAKAAAEKISALLA